MSRLQRFAPPSASAMGPLVAGIVLLSGGTASAQAQPGAAGPQPHPALAASLNETLQQLQLAQQQFHQIRAEGLVQAADRATGEAVVQTSRALQALQASLRTAPGRDNAASPADGAPPAVAAPEQPAAAPPNIDRVDGTGPQPGSGSTPGPSTPGPSTPGVTAVGSAAPPTNAGPPQNNGNAAGNTTQQAADTPKPQVSEPLPPPGITAAAAQEFVGKQVFNPNGQALGHLRRVITDGDGQVQSLVIEHGGFLGLFTSRSTVAYAPHSATVDSGRFILNTPSLQ